MHISDFLKSMNKDKPGPEGNAGQVPEEAAKPVTPVEPSGQAGPETGPEKKGPAAKILGLLPNKPAAGPLPATKKTAAGVGHYLSILKGKESTPVEEYDFERHGILVEPMIPPD
jgi:hypothetical protein